MQVRGFQQVDFDFTGAAVEPTVEYVKVRNPAGHGDMLWTRDLTTLRLACSVLGARDGTPEATPGSLGTVTVRLSTAALKRVRDEIDVLVGLAESTDDALGDADGGGERG